jgi:membrane-associated phospholipid phosphatase
MIDRRLLAHTAYSSAACAALVLLCYFYIDRPVALWVSAHPELAPNWLTASPDLIIAAVILSPLLVILVAIRRVWMPWRQWEQRLIVIAGSVMVIALVKELLKWVFGRPSPRTWIENTAFLVSQEGYEFHWFHGGKHYFAFPSGHTSIACVMGAIIWIVWPKWRWAVVLSITIVASCLVITNYHFVGDIVAGAFLGWLGGLWSAHLLCPWLRPSNSRQPP